MTEFGYPGLALRLNAQRFDGLVALGDVAAGVENGATVDRHAFYIDQEGMFVAVAVADPTFNVADLPGSVQSCAIEQMVVQQAIDAAHLLDFALRITEDDIDVRTNIGESAVFIGDEHGVGDAAESDAVEFFRGLQGLQVLFLLGDVPGNGEMQAGRDVGHGPVVHLYGTAIFSHQLVLAAQVADFHKLFPKALSGFPL